MRAQDWSAVKLLEEYDPADLGSVSRPHAYVADYVVQVDLSVSVSDEMQRYEERVRSRKRNNFAEDVDDPPMFFAPPPDKKTKTAKSSRSGGGGGTSNGGWFEKLRDQLQRGEDIRWYVVVNGDEVRDWPDEPNPYPNKTTAALPTSYQQQQPQYHDTSNTGSPTIVSRPPTTSTSAKQAQHHAQYMHQQQIYEGKDRGQMQVPLVPFPGLAGRGGGPAVPEKDLPVPTRLRQKMSYDGGGGSGLRRPKTPSKSGGGLRRLFGRSHHKGAEAEGN